MLRPAAAPCRRHRRRPAALQVIAALSLILTKLLREGVAPLTPKSRAEMVRQQQAEREAAAGASDGEEQEEEEQGEHGQQRRQRFQGAAEAAGCSSAGGDEEPPVPAAEAATPQHGRLEPGSVLVGDDDEPPSQRLLVKLLVPQVRARVCVCSRVHSGNACMLACAAAKHAAQARVSCRVAPVLAAGAAAEPAGPVCMRMHP